MSEILTDLSTPVLADAVKANLYEFFLYLKRSATVEFYESANLIRWHSRVQYPWFNGVLVSQAVPDYAAQIIQETQTYFRSRNVPVMTWWFEPKAPTAEWNRHLLAHGFGFDENTPGMAVELAALNEGLKTPSGFTIERVIDLDVLKEWTRIFIAGYQLPETWEPDMYALMADLGLDLPIRNYTGCLDGKPVATSNLFLAAGVAGIQCVATLPDARGRGIGAAMTLAPLLEARAMGYRAGVLQSSDVGYAVYQRLGFRTLCKMEHYFWK